jgi:ribosome biogenesis GTPase
MRTLQVSDSADGIGKLFAEISELAHLCRFRDCTHEHEPGCAVRDAVAKGAIDPERLNRWHKLQVENRGNTSSGTGPRGKVAGKFRPR